MDSSKFTLEIANRSHYGQILAFLIENFKPTEPLNVATNITEDEAMRFWPDIVNKSLEFPISTVVFDQDQQMVATLLCSIDERPKDVSPREISDPNENSENITSSKSSLGECAAVFADRPADEIPNDEKIITILDYLHKDLWKLVPDHVNKVMLLEIISVRMDCRRTGLAKKLLGSVERLCVEMGVQGVAALASAYNSQNLFAKCDYQVLSAMMHKNWLDKNGDRIFICMDLTDRTTLVFKETTPPISAE